MPSALERSRKEGIHDLERKPFAQHARPQRQHVGIVVLADHGGRERIGADATAHALHFVRGHHDALARAAQDDTQIACA